MFIEQKELRLNSNSIDFINKITTEDFSNPGKEIDIEKRESFKTSNEHESKTTNEHDERKFSPCYIINWM